MTALDLDRLRGWIGGEETGSDTLTPELVQRFNATFDLEGEMADGTDAPPMIHFCLAQPVAPTSALDPDGHPSRGAFLPPAPLPRRMWAGGAVTFHGAIRIGERIERRSQIRDVVVKEGRSGTLCFVTVEHEMRSGGRVALTERQDIVYRGAEAAEKREGGAPLPAPEGAHVRRIVPSALFLFRYSALTFNSHRIHYDAAYANDVEGYPSLVVHGPLQATLLALQAKAIRGAAPRQFRFRSLSPIFSDADFNLNAADEGQGLKLWTASVGGPVAMEASAEW